MPTVQTPSRRARDRYIELVRTFPLRPIRSRQSHEQAKRMLRSLSGRQPRSVEDYKSVLVTLISEYEQNAGHRIDTSNVTASDVVRQLLTERGMSANALANALGLSQSTVSEMLSGTRKWSRTAAIRISDYFRLNPGIFLR